MMRRDDQLMHECEKTARKLVKIAQVGVSLTRRPLTGPDLVVMFDTTRTKNRKPPDGLRSTALFREDD